MSVCIVGRRGTGKTSCLKNMIKKDIEEKKATVNDIYVFTEHPSEWKCDYIDESNISDDTSNILPLLKVIRKSDHHKIVIFDDFNIAYKNKIFDMLIESKHINLAVYIAVQHLSLLGKSAREQINTWEFI